MGKEVKIGIIGCGAIGSSLALSIAADFKGKARLVSLFDIDRAKSSALAGKLRRKPLACASLNSAVEKADLLIEATSAVSSWGIVKLALNRKKDVLALSVGGVGAHLGRMRRLAEDKGCKVYLPSGAVCGIDGLKASKLSGIKMVRLTTYKNPLAFKGVGYLEDKGIHPEKIRRDTVIFEGKAGKAVRLFPKNINVAAVLSIAGLGMDNTEVRIIASPKQKSNRHEIEVISKAGSIFVRTDNIAHPGNPKTSYLAYLSALAVLKQVFDPVKVGA